MEIRVSLVFLKCSNLKSIKLNLILRQIPSKKLEMENKLMEERLQFLKNELLSDKNKRKYDSFRIQKLNLI